MAIDKQYLSDFEEILSHRYDNGADYWTTPDKRLIKGSPFSTLDCVIFFLELGMEPTEPLLKECADLIFSTWKENGSFKLYPQGSIYPCQTAHAANVLCHMGYAFDDRLQKTFWHILDTQYADGGWRCNKFSFGRGPETQYSNPFPTLIVLDAFRFSDYICGIYEITNEKGRISYKIFHTEKGLRDYLRKNPDKLCSTMNPAYISKSYLPLGSAQVRKLNDDEVNKYLDEQI